MILAELAQHPAGFRFLIDTSAGISSSVVYFNAMSRDIFVVVTGPGEHPHPTPTRW